LRAATAALLAVANATLLACSAGKGPSYDYLFAAGEAGGGKDNVDTGGGPMSSGTGGDDDVGDGSTANGGSGGTDPAGGGAGGAAGGSGGSGGNGNHERDARADVEVAVDALFDIVEASATMPISHIVTFYGWNENNGDAISFPTVHRGAGGVGKY